MHDGADLIVWLADDLDGDDGGGCRLTARVAGIGERRGGEGKGAPRQAQPRHGPVAILHVGGLRIEDEGSPVGIDQGLVLSPLTVWPAS